MFKKIIGLIGGMGPFATIDFYTQMLNMLQVKTERDYPKVIISSNPQMPSRTRAFLFNEQSPACAISKEIKKLHYAGADFIVIICNSAHFFLPQIKDILEFSSDVQADIEIIDMVPIVAQHIANNYLLSKVAVLGGEVIMQSSMYSDALKQYGIETIPILSCDIKALRYIIDIIKHNVNSSIDIIPLCNKWIKKGAKAFILCCTELPMIFRDLDINIPIINGNEILMRYILEKAWCDNPNSIPWKQI